MRRMKGMKYYEDHWMVQVLVKDFQNCTPDGANGKRRNDDEKMECLHSYIEGYAFFLIM